MPTTTRKGLRYPALTSAPNIPQDIQNLATDVDGKGAPRGNGTAFPANPVEGDTYRHDTYGCTMRYRNGAWRQADVPYVTSNGARTSWQAALTAASLPLHGGFLLWQTNTDELWCADDETPANLFRLSGKPSAAVTAGFTAATNWTLSGQTVTNLGNGLAYLRATVTRANSAYTVGATGGLTAQTILTLPAGWEATPGNAGIPSIGARLCSFYVNGTNGTVFLAATVPGGDIAIGTALSLSGVYPLNNPAVS